MHIPRKRYGYHRNVSKPPYEGKLGGYREMTGWVGEDELNELSASSQDPNMCVCVCVWLAAGLMGNVRYVSIIN